MHTQFQPKMNQRSFFRLACFHPQLRPQGCVAASFQVSEVNGINGSWIVEETLAARQINEWKCNIAPQFVQEASVSRVGSITSKDAQFVTLLDALNNRTRYQVVLLLTLIFQPIFETSNVRPTSNTCSYFYFNSTRISLYRFSSIQYRIIKIEKLFAF